MIFRHLLLHYSIDTTTYYVIRYKNDNYFILLHKNSFC